MWTQQQAIWMIQSFEPQLASQGYHCALTGSVLYKGKSIKDLDIIIYPHWKKEGLLPDLNIIKKWLLEFFGASEIKDCASTSQERDDKHVCWLLTKDGQRIDFFFLM